MEALGGGKNVVIECDVRKNRILRLLRWYRDNYYIQQRNAVLFARLHHTAIVCRLSNSNHVHISESNQIRLD
jgi:hypothetical protein